MSIKQFSQCSSVLLFVLVIGNSRIAIAEIPVGYFTNIVPVLADPLYADYDGTVTADGLTMVFTNGAGSDGRPSRPGSHGSFDLFMATRTNTEEPFGNL